MKIPGTINQGDSVTWFDASTTDSQGNAITPPAYTLTWYFAGPTTLTVTSVAGDGGWQTTLTSEQTSAFVVDPNAAYYWQALAVSGSAKITLGTGKLIVNPTLSNALPGYDGRSKAEQALAAIEQAIEARITGGMIAEYTIGTRKLRNEPMSELLALRSQYKLIVARERQAQSIANGLGDPLNTFVRFG